MNGKSPPYLIPHKYYENEKSVIWEEFQIEFISIPGHSICSTGLVINNDTLFVGDTVMKDKHDKIVIPYICIQDIQIAINSINRIKEMKFKKLLLAHGKLIIGITKIQEKLDKMNTYLNELLVYEDKYLRNNVIFTAHRDFAVSKWHEHNLENVYRTIQK